MGNVLKVAKFEIVRQLKKPAFWAAILILPIMIGVILLIGYLAEEQDVNVNPEITEGTVVAITDEAGILPAENPYAGICETREECIEKVKNGEVDLYYYIPADFGETKRAEFYHISEGLDLFNYDANILRGILANVVGTRVDAMDAMVLSGGYEIQDNKLTKSGEDANALGKAVVPIAILVVFFMFIALFGNRFLMAVVEEKENRISEMILTSVSAQHLIVGKIAAMMTLGVIQIATLVIPAAILVFLNRENPMVAGILASVEIAPTAVVMNLILFIASVFLYAGTCVFVGSRVSTARDASSFIGPTIVAMVLPLYFMQLFLAGEPDFMVYFLTYFPPSAPIALMLRSGFGTLSTGEFLIGLIEVVTLAVVMVRLSVVTFRKNAINFDKVRLKLPRRK